MEDTVNNLTISDLIRRGQPLTVTSALNSSSFPSKSKSPLPSTSTNSNPTKILYPLTRSSILTGTLTLPTETLNCKCFQFSDDSSSICCDILDFSVRLIGKKIQILACNFIPLKHKNSTSGFIEIIKYCLIESTLSRCSTLLDSVPIVSGPKEEDKSKARYCLHGPIESIGPVSVVPSSIGANKPHNLPSFIAEIRVCECKLCNSFTKPLELQRQHHVHSFTKPLFIYFHGSFWSWHPVITKLVRKVVTLSGLKKKLVFIGKEESQLMFVISEYSVIHLSKLSVSWSPFSKDVGLGKRECGDYKGVVSGVYMQGMVVELDKEIWLLLTNQLLVVPHSLRMGAIVSLRNVHFVNPKFTWTRMLILGACFKTSITIESFSPLETGCHIVLHSQSHLGDFIESLSFSARMWVLLVISSFRKKFAGILSEKDILGTKHKEGLVHTFATSHLPPSVIRTRRGMLRKLCKNDAFGCGFEPCDANLRLVPAISTFLHHCEATWMKVLLQSNCHIVGNNCPFSLSSHKGRSHCQLLRRIFCSEDIGVSLIGSLEISPSSGRLQLVDTTGSIDVIIPDLPSAWKSNDIYEVVDYSLVMEGTPDIVDHFALLGNESFSCRHIFLCSTRASEMKLTIYIYFNLSSATCKNLPLYPSVGWNHKLKELQDERFHLIYITHKYPVLQKFQGKPLISNKSSMFVEATILGWDLLIAGKDGTPLPVKVSRDWLSRPLVRCSREDCQEHPPNKKHKIDQASSHTLASDLKNGCGYDCCELSSYSIKGSTEGKCGNSCPLEIPCSVTIRIGNTDNCVGSGKLCYTKSEKKTGSDVKPSTEKVLLEFNSENFFKYQLLQIGSYYIIKHHAEEPFCIIRDCNYANGIKIFITSRIHMWSLSFSSDEITTNDKSSNNPFQNDSSFSSRDSLGRVQVEQFLRVVDNSSESCSDVYLCLAEDSMSSFKTKINDETKGEDVDLPVAPEGTSNDFSNALTTISSSSFTSGSLDCTILPEGKLTSVCGHVVAIYGFDGDSAGISLSCERLGDGLDMRFSQGIISSFCFHVLVDGQMVNIFGSLRELTFPVGFGPDVNATFHRVLKLRATNKLKLTPVSFIVLNSIRIANEPFRDKSCTIESKCNMSCASSLGNGSSAIISELIESTNCKHMQFNCRVVAVHVLVLEKNRKYYDLPSELQSRLHFIDIPLLGFVVDDGTSTYCCWANAERAATFLRLHEELPLRAFESSGFTFKWVGLDKSRGKNAMFHLERITWKHNRVTVRNYGSTTESSYQDLIVSVDSDNTLSSSDENLLKFIVFNACFGTSWSVVARVMDPDAVDRLEKEHLIQMEMTLLRMQNIWAMEVQHVNSLTEARNVIQELLDR